MPQFLNKYQIAEQLGMTWHNVKKLYERDQNPMPYYKRRGNTIVFKGEPLIVPESVGNDRLIFELNEVMEWFKTI